MDRTEKPRLWIRDELKGPNKAAPGSGRTSMTKNASPQSGDVYLEFNGRDAFVEVPSITDYGVSTTGQLTISAGSDQIR
jgi:hypothetical protein